MRSRGNEVVELVDALDAWFSQTTAPSVTEVLIQKLFPTVFVKAPLPCPSYYPRSSRRPTTAGAKVHQRYLSDAFPVRCGRPVYLPYTSTSISTDYVPEDFSSPIPNS